MMKESTLWHMTGKRYDEELQNLFLVNEAYFVLLNRVILRYWIIRVTTLIIQQLVIRTEILLT